MRPAAEFFNIDPDPLREKIVAAARSCIVHDGVRVTISDVARKAAVSRPTIYRKYANAREMTADVLTQEMFTLLDISAIPENCGEFVDYIVRTTEKVRRNEVLRTIIKNEPELLLTYQFERLGRSQLAIIDVLAFMLEKIPDVRKGNLRHQAVFVLMLVQSAAFTANAVEGFIDAQALNRELTQMLEGYLLR